MLSNLDDSLCQRQCCTDEVKKYDANFLNFGAVMTIAAKVDANS